MCCYLNSPPKNNTRMITRSRFIHQILFKNLSVQQIFIVYHASHRNSKVHKMSAVFKKLKIAALEHWVKMSHAAIKEDRDFSGNVRKKPTSHLAGEGEESNWGSSSEGNNN